MNAQNVGNDATSAQCQRPPRPRGKEQSVGSDQIAHYWMPKYSRTVFPRTSEAWRISFPASLPASDSAFQTQFDDALGVVVCTP